MDEIPLKLHVGAGKPEAPCLGRQELMNMKRVPPEEDELPEVDIRDYLGSWAIHCVGDMGVVDYYLTRRHVEGASEGVRPELD